MLRFKKEDGSAFPDLREIVLADIMTERTTTQCISEDAPLLSFTIEQGVIDPSEKKTNKRDFLTKDMANKKYSLVEYNDIIYNPSNIIFGAINRNKFKRGVVSPIYAIFETSELPEYVELLVCNKRFINRSLKYLEGTVIKLRSLKPDDFLKLKVSLPCREEQKRIADFFVSVDKKIKQQEKIIAEYELLKTDLYKKILNKEIRFKDSHGNEYPEWINKTISELAVVIGGGTPSTSNEDFWKGSIPWISSSDLVENNINYISQTRYITEEAVDKSATKLIPKDSILIVSRVGIGKVAIADNDLCTSQDFTNLTNIKDNPVFLAYAVQKRMKEELGNVQGTSIKGIPSKDIKEYSIAMPCPEEQKKIADFLVALDKKIELEKSILEDWKQMRKALLQQMFV